MLILYIEIGYLIIYVGVKMKKKSVSIFICIIFLITSLTNAVLGQTNNNYDNKNSGNIITSRHIIINSDNAQNDANILISKGFDVLYETVTDCSFELIVTPEEYNLLQNMRYNIETISIGRPFIEIQNELYEKSPTMIPPGYLDLSNIINKMYEAESNYPSICKVYDLTDTYDMPSTYESRHIYALKISDNVAIDEDEPNFLMVSGHHAREIVTPVIALYSIDQLTTNYGSDPQITSFVDNYEIWICPVWNPDGYEYCFYYDNMWRKNRQPYPPGIGVDLNRNYPFGWHSACSGSTSPTSETFKGPSPASEPETQTMIAFSDDRHFAKVIDYHSYGREVLYGYCCHSHPFSSFFYSEAVLLSTAAGYGGNTRLPSAEGEHYEWQIWSNGSYANLMETHVTFQPTYNEALSEATMIWPSTIWLLNRPISISGNVIDSITHEPLNAEINLIGVNFQNDEKFFTEPRFGRYHLFLPAGTYNVQFSCENYHTQTCEVTVTQSSGINLQILLERINEGPDKPTIFGPTTGKPKIEYEYIFCSTDPDEDPLEYYINWGDGNEELWIGPYASGEEITLSHSWAEQGDYIIQAKVRDIYGLESESKLIKVNIPRIRQYYNFQFFNLLFYFFQNFLNNFNLNK